MPSDRQWLHAELPLSTVFRPLYARLFRIKLTGPPSYANTRLLSNTPLPPYTWCGHTINPVSRIVSVSLFGHFSLLWTPYLDSSYRNRKCSLQRPSLSTRPSFTSYSPSPVVDSSFSLLSALPLQFSQETTFVSRVSMENRSTTNQSPNCASVALSVSFFPSPCS